MTSFDPASSLEVFLGVLEGHNPHLKHLLLAKTETDFMMATEGGIERAIRKIEEGAKNYAVQQEPGLSQLLTDFLSCMGWRATAETNNNGHVDVVVECAFGRQWKYLGECKVHRGYQYHVEGCKQLLGYCTGREQRAFCMDFFYQQGAYEKAAKLRREIDENLPLGQTGASADHEIRGGFLTNHLHASGEHVEILHLACSVPRS